MNYTPWTAAADPTWAASAVPSLNIRGLRNCIASRLHTLRPMSFLLGERPGEAWRSLSWQRLKRMIAYAVASCLCSMGCKVYLADLHGGEPSEGLGGKDIDLILDCTSMVDIAALEQLVEGITASWLLEELGRDPYLFLGIPNIVELHDTTEFLFKKYVEAGPPYVFPLC